MKHLSQIEFVKSRQTVLDRILFYTPLPAVLSFFAFGIPIMLYPDNWALQRAFAITFIVLFAIAVPCRMIYTHRRDRYIIEYQQYLRDQWETKRN